MSLLTVFSVVGAQFGSEGKGQAVSALWDDVVAFVRVGGPNAGHTCYNDADNKYVLRSIPCGAVRADRETEHDDRVAICFIGAGAVIDPEVLCQELVKLDSAGCQYKLYIDSNATVIMPGDIEAEGGYEGTAHVGIGSTAKGIGAARQRRIGRGVLGRQDGPVTYAEWHARFTAGQYAASHVRPGSADSYVANIDPRLVPVPCDTLANIHGMASDDDKDDAGDHNATSHTVMLEGAQGLGLDLAHGPYPFVTSSGTGTAQMLADVGLSPRHHIKSVLVARTMPIRVAGNSGPLHNETTWEALSKRLGRPVTEQTTVTKKTRRIGEWDDELFARAVMRERPWRVFLTFADYLVDGSAAKATSWDELPGFVIDFIEDLERRHDVDVGWVSVGPKRSQVFANPRHND